MEQAKRFWRDADGDMAELRQVDGALTSKR
jgi:hypothetical protein